MVKKNLKNQKGGGSFGEFAGSVASTVMSPFQATFREGGQGLGKVSGKVRDTWMKIPGMKSVNKFAEKLPIPKDIIDGLDEITDPRTKGKRPNEIFQPKKTIFAENAFWQALYDDPCWIDPDTDSFTLSKLRKLWCKWHYSNVGDALGDLVNGEKGGDWEVDWEELEAYYVKKNTPEDEENEARAELISNFNETVSLLRGPNESTDDVVPVEPEKGTLKHMLQELGLTKGELIDKGNILTRAGISSPLEADIPPCERSKFIFCLIFKLLLGPAGLLILKMLPHFVKFFITIRDFSGKLFLGLANSTWNSTFSQKTLMWKDRDGTKRFDYKPSAGDTIFTYLGLVIPWGIVSYKRGQVWGNGEFGKFIFGLVLVSVGLITMGGLSVLVLLTAFLYYCGKTLSMFTSNIEPKTKK